jgi:hypothetical protein
MDGGDAGSSPAAAQHHKRAGAPIMIPPRRWAGLDAHRPRPWKPTSKCIFCGVDAAQTPEGALTREHVYSNWTRRFVPRTMKNYRSLRATAHLDRTDFVLVKRPGDVRDWQVPLRVRRMQQRMDAAADRQSRTTHNDTTH